MYKSFCGNMHSFLSHTYLEVDQTAFLKFIKCDEADHDEAFGGNLNIVSDL